MMEPYSQEHINNMDKILRKEADRIARKIGASGALIIVQIPAGDGEHFHTLVTGKAPKEGRIKLLEMALEAVKRAERGQTGWQQ